MKSALSALCALPFLLTVTGAPAFAAEAENARSMFGLVGMELAFLEALALIALACIFVPISRAVGLGTVIGYLVAGVVAGIVLAISFTRDPGELLHFAEFGVVLFLFNIGLEFRPARLWEMRGTNLWSRTGAGDGLRGAADQRGADRRA